MKYKIFEVEAKGEIKPDGYDIKKTYTHRLKDLDDRPFEMRTEFQYLPEAYLEIEKYQGRLAHKTLTILPIIEINWEGKIVQHD